MTLECMVGGVLVTLESNLKDIKLKTDAKVKKAVNSLLSFVETPVVAANDGDGHIGDGYIITPQPLEAAFRVKRIVVRPCYRHMLPIVEAHVSDGVCITGTPGIGKTVFGYFVFRDFIKKGRSVAYWDGYQATLFSKSDDHIKLFGLQNQCIIKEDKAWRWGAWSPDNTHLGELLFMEDVFVIHNPAPKFMKGGNQSGATNVVIILSFGHELLPFWNTKLHGMPEKILIAPNFQYDEILDNKSNLFFGNEKDDDQLRKLYQRFGGCVRCFLRNSSGPWTELKAKITDVAKRGCGITLRTAEHKATIVHVASDFDMTRPIFPEDGHNEFEQTGFILGSDEIANEFSRALASKGRDQLRAFMTSVRGQKGAEALYVGMLFEIHAHHFLRDSDPGKKVNIRVVRADGKNKSGYSTTTIQTDGVVEFESQEADGIAEVAGQSKHMPGTYIMPASSTFPTYDAAVVVPGSTVGLDDHERVALLLQMTVSGATSLLRRPKHSVKQYMRKAMHKALRASVDGFSEDSLSVTTFCVPTACFHPFIFQNEEKKDSESAILDSGQPPEFQFVIEIPGFIHLPVTDKPVGEIHGTSGRTHRYMFRERKAKELKLKEIHGEDLEDGSSMDESP